MFRKKEVSKKVDNVNATFSDKIVGVTQCESCINPSTYMNIDGKVFCSLSCETKN